MSKIVCSELQTPNGLITIPVANIDAAGSLWNINRQYKLGDIITYDSGHMYAAIRDNSGKQPNVNLADWKLRDQGLTGPRGAQGVAGVGISVHPPVADDAARLALAQAPGLSVLQIDTGDFWTSDGTTWHDGGHMQGPAGSQGAQGIPGIQGQNGTGVTIKGSDTLSNILAKTGVVGDMWLDSSTGKGYVSDGAGTGTTHWTDVGSIQGPAGPQGSIGPSGNAGSNGNDGTDGNDGAQGIQGIQGQAGATGQTGTQGIDGVGINIHVPVADIPARDALTQVAGLSVFVISTGDFYTSDGTNWVDAGHMQGPQGIQGVTGSAGAAGQDGATGTAGTNGTGVTIKGSSTVTVILAKTGTAGDMWIDTGSGDGYVSDGVGSGAAHWTNVGSVQGPTGNAGTPGAQGIQGVPGSAGTTGQQGATGTPGIKGDPGNDGSDGNDGQKGDPGNDGTNGTNGSQGIRGVQGIDGIGISIHAPVADQAARLALTQTAGLSVLQTDTGEFWTSDGTTWTDAGHFQGPEGPIGPRGPSGANSTVVGPKGPVGPQGPSLITDWNQATATALDFIKNKPTIPAATVVVDNLTSNQTTQALSAKQGKTLEDNKIEPDDYATDTVGGTLKALYDASTSTLYIRNDGQDAVVLP